MTQLLYGLLGLIVFGYVALSVAGAVYTELCRLL